MPVRHFDEATHTYTVDGVVWPSVSRIIAPLADDDYASVPQSVMEQAAQRGRYVHAATALHDVGKLDESTLDPALIPYLDAYKKFIDDTGFKPKVIEYRVYNDALRYAGTLDRIGELTRITPLENDLIDIKSTAKIMRSVRPQLRGYWEGWKSMGMDKKIPVRGIRSLQLRDDGNYRLSPRYTDVNDLRCFVSLLTIHNWMTVNV